MIKLYRKEVLNYYLGWGIFFGYPVGLLDSVSPHLKCVFLNLKSTQHVQMLLKRYTLYMYMCICIHMIIEYLGLIRAIVLPGKYYKGIQDLVSFIRYFYSDGSWN